jgi:hypothetical protein
VQTLDEAAALIARGFSLRMGAKGRRPSLIAPQGLRIVRDGTAPGGGAGGPAGGGGGGRPPPRGGRGGAAPAGGGGGPAAGGGGGPGFDSGGGGCHPAAPTRPGRFGARPITPITMARRP